MNTLSSVAATFLTVLIIAAVILLAVTGRSASAADPDTAATRAGSTSGRTAWNFRTFAYHRGGGMRDISWTITLEVAKDGRGTVTEHSRTGSQRRTRQGILSRDEVAAFRKLIHDRRIMKWRRNIRSLMRIMDHPTVNITFRWEDPEDDLILDYNRIPPGSGELIQEILSRLTGCLGSEKEDRGETSPEDSSAKAPEGGNAKAPEESSEDGAGSRAEDTAGGGRNAP